MPYGFIPMSGARRTGTIVIGTVRTGGRRTSVAIFIVRRTLPGLDSSNLAKLHRALAESARRLTAHGDPVAYLRCLYAPERGDLLCVFRAASEDAVRRVNEVAQVPFDCIESGLDFTRPGRAVSGRVPGAPRGRPAARPRRPPARGT